MTYLLHDFVGSKLQRLSSLGEMSHVKWLPLDWSTDNELTMATSLILCSPNSNPSPKEICRNPGEPGLSQKEII